MKTKEEIQEMLDGDINKAIAAHRGKITILDRDEGSVYVEMIGGCQGCAGARYTLNSIVSQAIKEFDPTIDEVIDETDHLAAGAKPFTKRLTMKKKSKTKRIKREKYPKRKILCKIYDEEDTSDEYAIIIYDNHTWRWGSAHASDTAMWELGFFPKLNHHIFFYKEEESEGWCTNYHSLDDREIRIGAEIARALADREMDKILRSSDGMP